MLHSRSALTLVLSAATLSAALLGACRKTAPPPKAPEAPSLRLYFMSTVAGAIEPCGCRKDMLGGIDHAAALLRSQQGDAPHRLLLGVGPLFFLNPTLTDEARQQELWKAESLAASLADLKLGAWAPGINDFAAGRDTLRALATSSGAQLVAANLNPEPGSGALPFSPIAAFSVGKYRVGVAGIGAAPAGGQPQAPTLEALNKASQALDAEHAEIKVALLAVPRGDALRLAEQVPTFNVIALGKPSDEGEANDPPFPPTLVGQTLVLQAPNHLQGLASVDFFVVDGDLSFADRNNIARQERRESLERQVAALRTRLDRWQADSNPSEADIKARRAGLVQLEAQLTALQQMPVTKPQGSSFRYELAVVRETAGTDPTVAKRLESYYRRVNEHNRKAFADRKPVAVSEGQAHYAGAAACASCHEDATTFWEQTPHADAYATLSREFKEFNLDCVSCHVTGYNRPGGSTVTHVDSLKNVQCEACHGPGSRHVESDGEVELIIKTPPETTCQSCHHSPHVADDWKAENAWPNIIGPGHGAPKPAEAKQ